MPTERSRRWLLGRGATLGATGLAASVAGCGFFADGDPAYAGWLHRPGVLDDDPGHYTALHMRPAAIADHESAFEDGTYRSLADFADRWALTGLSFPDVEEAITYRASTVVTGSFDAGTVVEPLDDEGFIVGGNRRGFEVLTGPEGERAVAVDDGAAVVASGTEESTPFQVAHATVDAREGAVDRYHEIRDAMGVLVDRLGAGTMTTVETFEPPLDPEPTEGRFERSFARGRAWTVRGDRTDASAVVVFRDESSVNLDAVQDWIAGPAAPFEVDEPEVSRSGRTAVVRAELPTERI